MKCEYCKETCPDAIGFNEPGRCDVCGAGVGGEWITIALMLALSVLLVLLWVERQ